MVLQKIPRLGLSDAKVNLATEGLLRKFLILGTARGKSENALRVILNSMKLTDEQHIEDQVSTPSRIVTAP